jgi:DNA-binding winged helix-turn-helix (wHTH) protein
MEEHPLLIIQDENTGKQWERPLTSDKLVIGREETCGLALSDRQISRRHATITREGDRYILRDEGSRNGTFLDGALVLGPKPLRDGDEIRLAARFRIIFVASEATAPLYRAGPTPRGIYVDRASRRVWVDGVEVKPSLSSAQYRLLEFLYSRTEAICTRNEIIDAVWPDEAAEGVTDQAIDALVRRLRERLSSTSTARSNLEEDENRYIETIRGHGFRLKQT